VLPDAAYAARPHDPSGVGTGIFEYVEDRVGLPLAEAEPDTAAWLATKIDDSTYGTFDVFPSADGRRAQRGGPIAATLMSRADELLAAPPDIKPIDVRAAKL